VRIPFSLATRLYGWRRHLIYTWHAIYFQPPHGDPEERIGTIDTTNLVLVGDASECLLLEDATAAEMLSAYLQLTFNREMLKVKNINFTFSFSGQTAVFPSLPFPSIDF
jgi:hypothetical protein